MAPGLPDRAVSAVSAPLRSSRLEPATGAAPGVEAPPPAFAFAGVTKRFGAQEVLHGIDLTVAGGEFLAVIGKSGCGKSTLLRLLAGLDRPTAGTIRFGDGIAGPGRTRLMFQEARLMPWARVAANVAVGLTGLAAGAEARRRTEAILDEVGLRARGEEWPAVLSGGQKSRVALARALVGAPRILALDEPLGALDALTRIEMRGLIERIWRSQGFTAVLVTHDVAEAVALADRVVVIDAGRIALDLSVALPRPRRHGSAEAARLEGQILDSLFVKP